MERNKKGQFLKGIHYSINTEFKKGQHWRKPNKLWNKEWLYNKYHKEKLSIVQIANIIGCKHGNVTYWLKKHNIKTRTMKEIRKIKKWGQIGSDNPMWNRKGELNPMWKGGITVERQSFYSSQEWKNICKEVYKRDKNICQRCKLKKDNSDIPFHIHHLKSFADKDLRSDINNLILLCEICHIWIHSNKNINKDFIHV